MTFECVRAVRRTPKLTVMVSHDSDGYPGDYKCFVCMLGIWQLRMEFLKHLPTYLSFQVNDNPFSWIVCFTSYKNGNQEESFW